MPSDVYVALKARSRRWFGGFRPAYLPILLTYFCYGASAVTAVALLFFEKEALKLTPAEAAGIAFWLGLPWSMKMVAGVASDVYPIRGSRRGAYLLIGALCTLAGYAWLAGAVQTKAAYLAASLLVTVGLMVQDVVADALSVEVARTDEEMGQIQTLGRIVLLAGGISVGYLSGVLAGWLGPRGTFACAMVLPLVVAAGVAFIPREVRQRPATSGDSPFGAGKARLVLLVGLSYAAFGARFSGVVPYSEAIVSWSPPRYLVLLAPSGSALGRVAAVVSSVRAPRCWQGYS